MSPELKIMGEFKIFFLLTKQELDLLESASFLEPWLCDNIDNAKKKDGQYIVNLCDYDIDETLGALAYSAACAESYSKKEAYIKLHNKIKENYLRSKDTRRSIIEKQIRKQLE